MVITMLAYLSLFSLYSASLPAFLLGGGVVADSQRKYDATAFCLKDFGVRQKKKKKSQNSPAR